MTTNAGHLSIAAIHPSRSPSYSRNLHRWLAEFGHGGKDISEHVYRVTLTSLLHRRYQFAPGDLVIGGEYVDLPHEEEFSGAQLVHVLGLGSQALRMCYPGGMAGLERIDGFWERYRVIGRCAIDPEHRVHFRPPANRFKVDGDTRSCLWCGATQRGANELTATETWKAA